MTDRERSGIPWVHELALRLGILVAALVLSYCVGCDPVPPMAFTPLPEPPWTPTPTAIPPGGFRTLPPSTAQPVSTATLTPPRRFLRWLDEITPPLEIIEDAPLTMGRLLSNPKVDDATWNALLAAQVVRIREADAALRRIVPPEGCGEAHAMLRSSTRDGLRGAEYVLEGVQQRDIDLVEQGLEYMASATAKMDLFGLMVEAMTP